jgi:hypothetical protein
VSGAALLFVFLWLSAGSASANSLVVTSWQGLSRGNERCARVSVLYKGGIGYSVLIDNDDIVALMETGKAYYGTSGAFNYVRANSGEEFTGIVCFGHHRWPIRDIWTAR